MTRNFDFPMHRDEFLRSFRSAVLGILIHPIPGLLATRDFDFPMLLGMRQVGTLLGRQNRANLQPSVLPPDTWQELMRVFTPAYRRQTVQVELKCDSFFLFGGPSV
jgi:hypothetical protein